MNSRAAGAGNAPCSTTDLLLAGLQVWDDPVPRPPAIAMAVDEVLLLSRPQDPVLRHYRWAGRCASFGVSQSHGEVRAGARGYDLVRRWTGGGIVHHDACWTFSLIVPAGTPFASLRPRDSYAALHQAVLNALSKSGIPARLATPVEATAGSACFTAPVACDVLGPRGEKLCGGAQRRTRHGLLHQGSIQNCDPPPAFIETLAAVLSPNPRPFEQPTAILAAAEPIAQTRYGNPAWSARVP